MGAFGSAVGVIFGVIWTGAAASMGAPPFFLAFGVLFIIVGIVQLQKCHGGEPLLRL